ncbi:uncharacterized protein LOC131182085 [Hevea brasiliensis]|uniref:uncharacterized protein LOC131182085 n=1 Tax=Hevea brasiliensis TaxID=3981 RepID=UPI0025F19FA8|nr:uncharacterized protein LOC131182085 [Hevea brasiliensis]
MKIAAVSQTPGRDSGEVPGDSSRPTRQPVPEVEVAPSPPRQEEPPPPPIPFNAEGGPSQPTVRTLSRGAQAHELEEARALRTADVARLTEEIRAKEEEAVTRNASAYVNAHSDLLAELKRRYPGEDFSWMMDLAPQDEEESEEETEGERETERNDMDLASQRVVDEKVESHASSMVEAGGRGEPTPPMPEAPTQPQQAMFEQMATFLQTDGRGYTTATTPKAEVPFGKAEKIWSCGLSGKEGR